MRTFLSVSLGTCLLFSPAFGQEEEARAVLQKAVKAHGGDKLLAKLTAAQTQSKGKIHILGGADFTAEESVQFPDKFKSVVQLTINGANINVTQVFNGEKGWVHAMDKTMDMDKETVTEMRELMHAARVSSLVEPLKDKRFKLSTLGEAKVKGKDTVGVRVSHEGRRDVNLYFDKTSGLLLKSEGRAIDPIGKQEVNQEKFIVEYRDLDGLKAARKLEIHNDGKLFLELEIVEIKLLEKHDANTFARP